MNILNNNNPLDEFRKRNGQELIINLNNKIKVCAKCDNNFCHKCYYGNANAKVLIINDNATNDKDILEYFNTLLEMSEMNLNDIFIINAVSCVTTRKDKEKIIQRIPSKKECNGCKCFLNQAIKIVNPRIIISLGATALNQFIPNSNLLEYVHTKQVFNGIPTLIDYSVKDLFDLTPYKSEEEIDEISYGILNTFNEAARYIKALRSDLYDNKNTR